MKRGVPVCAEQMLSSRPYETLLDISEFQCGKRDLVYVCAHVETVMVCNICYEPASILRL